ncbi:MAG: hypothetical protein AB2723_10515 [Candidatus Thiodiazotropha sp.]
MLDLNKPMEDKFFDSLYRISMDLNLPKDFLFGLLEEDDWSFVIKAHSLLEGALSYSLTTATGKEELADFFAEIDMKMKIDAAKGIKLFDSDLRKFLRALSNLRNKLVHNVSNVGFSFEEYFKNIDTRNNFVDNFGLWKEEFEIQGKSVSNQKFSIANPKLTIFMGLIHILIFIDVEKMKQDLKYEEQELLKMRVEDLNNLSLIGLGHR